MAYFWVLHNDSGAPFGQAETFDSAQEAESWLVRHWESLRAEGAVTVELFDDDQAVYEMSLEDQ